MTRLVPTAHAASQLTLTGYVPGPQGQPEGTGTVGDLWRILWRRRVLIVATAALLFLATLAYGMLAPPLYAASSEIIIDPRDRQVVVNDVNPSAVAPDGGVTQIESQARVIESSSVLLRAIAATHLTQDPEFNGEGPLSALAKLIGRGPATPRPAADEEATTLRTLKRRLAVKRADKVFVIEMVVTAHSAAKAAMLANAIAEAYLADQAEAKAQAGQRASAALSARLDQQRARVEAAENAIQQYKAANGIVTAGGQLVGDQKLIELSNQLTAAQGRTAALRAKVDQLNGASRGGADSTTEALQSATVSKLREQEGTLVQRQSELEARLGPKHPSVGSISLQLANVRQLIATELNRVTAATQSDYARAVSNERLLAAQLDEVRAASRSVGQASVRLRELERDLEASRTVYAAFLVRAQETREQASIDTTNARIITRAMPPQEKSWPPLGLLLGGAVGSGLGLGGAIALIREYVRPTILSREQIERAIGAPVIAILAGSTLGPRVSGRRRAGGGDESRPQVLAKMGLALRRLFPSDGSGHEATAFRSLLVTSGLQDAAARRQVCHLFAAASRMRGDRVLLVDADMAHFGATGRKKSGGAATGAPGLLEVMHDGCPLESVIDHSAGQGVARLGKGRERTAIAADSGWSGAARMLSDARRTFDLMVIDGGALTENIAIAPLLAAADEVLLVGQLARTTQQDADGAADAATVMGRPVSAILLVDSMMRG